MRVPSESRSRSVHVITHPAAVPPAGFYAGAFVATPPGPVRSAIACGPMFEAMPLEEAVDYIVDECFFTVGQVVGDRKTLDVAALIWWRDHYRSKFLAAMRRFGNRWMTDNKNVKAVGRLLAERAMEHSGDASSIDQRSAMKAAADAERYCTLHAMRRMRRCGEQPSEEVTWIAGYWCGEGGPLTA